jgi:hypothetical protein
MDATTSQKKLWGILATVLDQVDYTSGACTFTEMVGAVLPKEVIALARDCLKECRPKD